jgi:hypothetical protein
MNSYEERQEARKQRYKEKAQGLAHLSNELAAESSKMARAIPFGQPILVGHHSEKSDRSYRAKIGAKMDKAVAAQDKAEYYAQKAESVGKGGISSYDPEAIKKIKEKIESLQAENRKPKDSERPWRNTYNNAEIRRLKQRLNLLEKYAEIGTQEVEKNGYKCTQDPEEMRVMFEFDGKPSEEVRDILKGNGFKWSRYACAWVRKLTPNACYQARLVMKSLDQLASGEVGE